VASVDNGGDDGVVADAQLTWCILYKRNMEKKVMNKYMSIGDADIDGWSRRRMRDRDRSIVWQTFVRFFKKKIHKIKVCLTAKPPLRMI